MAKYEVAIIGDFQEVLNHLQQDIANSGVSMKLVDESDYRMGETKVAVRVYDKYYMRNGNRASLSLTVVGANRNIYISAIGAGGGSGIFVNFSLGAETEMVAIVQKSVGKLDVN